MRKRIFKIIFTLTAVVLTAFAVFTLYGCDFSTSTGYCTVTFNSVGGSDVAAQRVEKGDKATVPDEPEKDGYVFDGWFTDPDYAESSKFNFNATLSKDVTLYAKWTESASGGDEQTPPSGGDEQTPPSDCTPPSGSDEQTPPSGGDDQNPPSGGDEQTPPSDGDDEPEQPVYYTVTFNSNNGSAVPAQYVLKDGKAVSPQEPVRSGYIFAGWYSGNDKYNFNTAVTSDITLTAKWVADSNIYYTVTFITNVDSLTLPAQEVIKGGKAAKPQDPEYTGHSLEGWYTDERLTNSYDFDAAVTQDVTLYAKWIESPVYYTVTFESNGGNDLPDQLVESGKTAAEPKTPVKNNYDFDGWYADAELAEQYEFDTEVTQNITLYAKWVESTQQPAEPPVEPPVEQPTDPAYEWVSTQADFTDSKISEYNASGNRTPEAITVDRFTIGSNVYVEGTSSGLKLEYGDINTQGQSKAVTFTLNGTQNTISFEAKGASDAATLQICKADGTVIKSWQLDNSETLTLSRNELDLEAGTYYIGSTGGSVRIGSLVIYEYLAQD